MLPSPCDTDDSLFRVLHSDFLKSLKKGQIKDLLESIILLLIWHALTSKGFTIRHTNILALIVRKEMQKKRLQYLFKQYF